MLVRHGDKKHCLKHKVERKQRTRMTEIWNTYITWKMSDLGGLGVPASGPED